MIIKKIEIINQNEKKPITIDFSNPQKIITAQNSIGMSAINLGEISNIFRGYSAKRRNIKNNNEDETEKIKLVSWKDLYNSTSNQTDITYTDSTLSKKYNKDIKYMQKGDIVLPYNANELDKMLYIENEPKQKYTYNDSVIVIRLNNNIYIRSEILFWILKSDKVKEYIFYNCKRKNNKTPIVTKEIISKILLDEALNNSCEEIYSEYAKMQESYIQYLLRKKNFEKLIYNTINLN